MEDYNYTPVNIHLSADKTSIKLQSKDFIFIISAPKFRILRKICCFINQDLSSKLVDNTGDIFIFQNNNILEYYTVLSWT